MFYKASNNRLMSETNESCNCACPNQIIHTIVAGDTLFSLANRYNTTVNEILALNPGTEIYNLQIGSSLIICPGKPSVTPVPPIGTLPPVTPVPPIGIIPPPVAPPIGTLPPITPIPPIGPEIPESVRELIACILQWIRRNFGSDTARRIIENLNSEIWKY